MPQKILGVRFDNVTLDEALKIALEFANDKKRNYICTPNPEILLKAQNNPAFLKILNRSGLNIPDGWGILLAAKWQKQPLKERVTGTDLMREILRNSKDKIFLLGGQNGVSKKIDYKNIIGRYEGTPRDDKAIELINQSGANILFVAFGAPAQELWIARNLHKLTSVKLAIGVGGAFDFLAGRVKRAPKWMQRVGLEWLYRLLREPRRITRIYNATIKFPIKVIWKKS